MSTSDAVQLPPGQVRWDGRWLTGTFMLLMRILRRNPPGAFGYKCSVVARAIQPMAEEIGRNADLLNNRYRKELKMDPNGDGPKMMKAPVTDPDGNPYPKTFWCSNPEAYDAEEKSVMEVPNTIHIPVRFAYEEVVNYTQPIRDMAKNIVGWEGIEGMFWLFLSDLIDPPIALPGPPSLPVPAEPPK